MLRDILGRRPAIFLACFVAWTITNMDQALFGYALPGLLTDFHQPLTTAGVILTVSFLASALLVIPAAAAGDRFGRGTTMCFLLALSASLVGLQGLAAGVTMLTVSRALAFGFSSGLSPLTNALVTENSQRARGLAMGVLQCGYPLGWLIASFYAAPLLTAYGWRAVCIAAFAVVPLALLLWAPLRRAERTLKMAHVSPQGGGTSSIAMLFAPPLRHRSFASITVFFLFGGAYAGSAFFFPTYFAEARGYGAARATTLVGLSNGIAVFGYLTAAYVGEYLLPRRTVFVLWCLLGAAALAGLLWLSRGETQDLVWYGLTAALFFGSQAVVATLVAEAFPMEVRSTALGVCASAPLSLGFALFPLIVPSVVAAIGWQAGLSAVVIPLLIGAGVIALLLPRPEPGPRLA